MYKYIILSICVCMASAVLAQREVIVEPGLNTLNLAIAGDTTDTGERTDLNTIYVLRRDGVYKTQFDITNQGFDLHVAAESGAGAMPIIQPSPLAGNEINRPFTIQNDLTLEGIYISDYADNGGFDTRIIRATGPSIKVVLKDCWLDGSGQSAVRFDSPNAIIHIENCIISHIGRPSNTGNGRIIDIRGTGGIGADTIIVRNNTFYNIARRLTRFSADLGAVYFEVDHNTFVNSVVQFINFEQTLNATVTNNLLVNPSIEGTARGAGVDLFEIDQYTIRNVYENAGYDGDRRIFLSNNFIHYQPELLEVWADSVEKPDVYDDDIYLDIVLQDGSQVEGDTLLAEQVLNAEPYIFEGDVQFVNAPRPNRSLILGILDDALNVPNRDQGNAPNWNFTLSPFFKIINESLEFPWEFPYDFSYDILSPAATSGTDGGPVGDPRWVPQAIDIVVGAEDALNMINVYPNPASDFIYLSNAGAANSISIVDQSGKRVFYKERPDAIEDISFLAEGMYVLSVKDKENNLKTIRLIKK